MRFVICGLLATLSLAAGGRAQDEFSQPFQAPLAPAPDSLSQARAAAERGDAAEALSRYLRVLAGSPDNLEALTGAGRGALGVGDVNAAMAFYARAEELAPRNGTVKAGLAAAMTQVGRAREALRFFREAVAAGIAPETIAADRGLAYDLTGQPKRAQADYALALRARPTGETLRRLALSQAIGGDRTAALATLDPMLRKQETAAWRARVFVEAMTGDLPGAQRDAQAVLPSDQAAALQPYLVKLGSLRAEERAAAVHLGRFPSSAPRVASADARRPNLPLDRDVLTSSSLAAGPTVQTATSQFAFVGPRLETPRPVGGPSSVPAVASPPPAPRREIAATQMPSPVAATTPATSSAALRPVVVAPDPAERARLRAEAAAKARTDKRAAQAKLEAAAKAKAEREEKLAARADPERQWVQVAGGANKQDLPKAWAQLKAKWPSQLAGKTAWTMPYRFTNRLLIGPFPNREAAQEYVGKVAGQGMGAFRVETAAGTAVERLAAK